MGRTVDELLDDVSWGELQLWFAYMALEPIGTQRHDLLTANLLAHYVNSHLKQDVEPYPLTRFLLFERMLEQHEKASRDDSDDADIELTTVAFLIASAKQHDPTVEIPIRLDDD